MYKIFLTCRNRLAVTTKCITALKKHSLYNHQIYVYENLTTNKIQEHFMYWCLLYEQGLITQVTFNTKDSTFDAFSKAVACNQFGHNHEMDPKKDSFDFLVFIDNDIIVTPGWDKIIIDAWKDINRLKMNNIKIIGQLPGGIQNKKNISEKISGFNAQSGTHGGSGFWSVKPNFFRDVGYLDVHKLVGLNKKHDQNYWLKLSEINKGKDYILGIDHKLVIHVGKIAGSCCNVLTKNKNLKQKNIEDLIKFEASESYIDSMKFDEFYRKIENDITLTKDW